MLRTQYGRNFRGSGILFVKIMSWMVCTGFCPMRRLYGIQLGSVCSFHKNISDIPSITNSSYKNRWGLMAHVQHRQRHHALTVLLRDWVGVEILKRHESSSKNCLTSVFGNNFFTQLLSTDMRNSISIFEVKSSGALEFHHEQRLAAACCTDGVFDVQLCAIFLWRGAQ